MQPDTLQWIATIAVLIGLFINWYAGRKAEIRRQSQYEETLKALTSTQKEQKADDNRMFDKLESKPHIMLESCQVMFNGIQADLGALKGDLGEVKGSLNTLIKLYGDKK